MTVSRRLATLPWPVLLLLALAWCGLTLGLLAWIFSWQDDSGVTPVAAGVMLAAAVLAVVVIVVRWHRLRAAGRWEPYLDAADAFQRRQVPAHPAARAELARMAAQQRATLWTIRWGWVVFGAGAAVMVPEAVDAPRRWVMVVLFAGLAVAYPFLYRRIRGQVEAAERASA